MLCSRPGSSRSAFLPSLLLVLVAAGCADEPGPLAPTLKQDPPSVGVTSVDDLIVDLFNGGHRNAAQRRVRSIQRQYDRGQTEAAEGQMFDLIAWTLERQAEGQIQDPNGGSPPTIEEAVSSFISELFTLVALPAPQIPPEALAPGGAAEIVDETGGSVAPEDPVVGVQVPPGAFSGPTLVTIAPLPPAFPPLPTGLTQFQPYYEINASSQPATDVVIGICYLDDPPDAGGVPTGFPSSRLRIAHPDPLNSQIIEILPVAPVPSFLDCATAPVPNVSPSQASVFPVLDWAGSKLGRAVSRWLKLEASTKNAVMAHRGLGGSLRSFSPFAVVDIQSGGSISILSGNGQVAPNGTTLPNATAVEVLDAVGLPLPGVVVQFTILEVYGSGNSGAYSPTSAVTNAAGQAQTNWTLSAGGEANLGVAAVPGFSAPQVVLDACGTFVGNSLNAFVQSYDANTGDVTINGGDWRRPIGSGGVLPFRFDWGDGSPPTDSFFAASHTYANRAQNYTVTVTATYCDGTTDMVTTTVPFAQASFTDLGSFSAALGGASPMTEDFNSGVVGTPVTSIFPGILDVSSTFLTLEIFSGNTLFGYDATTRAAGNGRYDLSAVGTPTYNAVAFDIISLDPATAAWGAVTIQVTTTAGSWNYFVTNPLTENDPVFFGIVASSPIVSVAIIEGPEIGGSGNEEIGLDNFVIAVVP